MVCVERVHLVCGRVMVKGQFYDLTQQGLRRVGRVILGRGHRFILSGFRVQEVDGVGVGVQRSGSH